VEPLERNVPIVKTGPKPFQSWMSPVVRWTDQPVFREPLSPSSEPAGRSWDAREFGRRALNLVVAGTSMILASPVFLILALAVKVSSPGPIFYRQERVGLNRRHRSGDRRKRARDGVDRRGPDSGGKVFRMIKFRTMYVDGEKQGQVWARKNDPRITPVGRVLRAFRLDELPQLWNVIWGDMNIVGPRPEQPEIFDELRSEISEYSERQRVLPGITGWAQVNNGYDESFQDVKRKLGYDLEYLEKKSPGEDFKIMARTIPVVLGRKGYH
jgi:lipopolysaccharide/colanic/teichoic acid biosynthesis glycosyltransferase